MKVRLFQSFAIIDNVLCVCHFSQMQVYLKDKIIEE